MNAVRDRKVYVQSCLDLADKDGLITLTFPDSDSLEANEFWQSDDYDCSPEDLTVKFSVNDVELAIKVLNEYKDISSLHFNAIIDSNRYKGKLRGDQLLVTPYGVYAEFHNDYTKTTYQIALDSMINTVKTAKQSAGN